MGVISQRPSSLSITPAADTTLEDGSLTRGDGGALVCAPKATVQPWIMQIVSALDLPDEVELFE